ncbi:thioesterase II family protein [Brachybacterium sp. AOP35-5H-19]|uniref:thioesterase II family protein n=1 Tax=Brachybacterium sp. AOP35-5H-19 TaxID=3457685 RepID=UPI003FB70216
MPSIVSSGAFPFVAERREGRLVFCFHHAGGTASAYRAWVGADPRIDAVPVELPGKATRRAESWVGDFSLLSRQIAEEILELADGERVVLYGHSMGAALAYRTAAHLQEVLQAPPEAVVVAARQAPDLSIEGEYHSSMGLSALREELETLGGTPPEILADADLMDLLLTGIRSDYMLHEDFRHSSTVLSCPLLALAGEQDPAVAPEKIAAWSRFTSGRFVTTVMPGGHFFPLDRGPGFLDELADGIDEILGLSA